MAWARIRFDVDALHNQRFRWIQHCRQRSRWCRLEMGMYVAYIIYLIAEFSFKYHRRDVRHPCPGIPCATHYYAPLG